MDSNKTVTVEMTQAEWEEYKRVKDGWFTRPFEVSFEVKTGEGDSEKRYHGKIIRQAEPAQARYAVEKLGGGLASAASWHEAMSIIGERLSPLAE